MIEPLRAGTLEMTPSSLQDELCQVTQKALAIDIRPFEGSECSILEGELLPAVRDVVCEGLALLDRVLEHYESDEPSEPATESEGHLKFYEGIDDLVACAPAAQRVADIAFMARWELRTKYQSLQVHDQERDPWAILSTCGSARRRLIKSTVAVELALCQYEGLDSLLEKFHITELRRSLETRRAYALFRKAVTKLGEGESLKARLRRGGIAIATLVGRDVYADLRSSDRKQLRALQEEVLDWLRRDGGYADETGTRLCENLAVFSNVLLQVNHRAELREHDRAVLAEVYSTLFSSSPPPESLHVATRKKLKPLLGRDPEIDELIENPEARTMAEWQSPMRRLLQTLESLAGHGGNQSNAEDSAQASASASFA